MGTHCFINIYGVTPSDGTFPDREHLVTIVRSTDGLDAYEKAIKFCDYAQIENGAPPDGHPEGTYNGPGRFALALINTVGEGWEDYTTICSEIDFEQLDDEDILLNIIVPLEGQAVAEQ